MARGSELFFYVDKFPKAQNGLGFTTIKTERIKSSFLTEGFEVAHDALNDDLAKAGGTLEYISKTALGILGAVGTAVKIGLLTATCKIASVAAFLGPVGVVAGVAALVVAAIITISSLVKKSAWDYDAMQNVNKVLGAYYEKYITVIGHQISTTKPQDEKIFAHLNQELITARYLEKVFESLKNTDWRSEESKENTAKLHNTSKLLFESTFKKINSLERFFNIEIVYKDISVDRLLAQKLNRKLDVSAMGVAGNAEAIMAKGNITLNVPIIFVTRKEEYLNAPIYFNDFMVANTKEAVGILSDYDDPENMKQRLEDGRKINNSIKDSGILTKEQIEDLVRWEQAMAGNSKIEAPKEKEPEKLNPKNPANTGASTPTIKEKEPEKPKELIKPQIIEEKKTEPVKRQNHTKKLFLGLLLLLILKQNKKDGNT